MIKVTDSAIITNVTCNRKLIREIEIETVRKRQRQIGNYVDKLVRCKHICLQIFANLQLADDMLVTKQHSDA